jgi:methionyl-tRNA formyltransferase
MAENGVPMPLRVIFMGTAEWACASLRALLAAREFQVVAAVTQPDRPKGREMKEQAPPVKTMAEAAGVPVLQPQTARAPAFAAELAALRPDLTVVAAYGQILPQAVLDVPKFGSVNVHASLLPKYRGAAPIAWAILNHEPETGVCIMKMAAGMDTGDILSRRATPIDPDETAATLHDRLAAIGADLLVATLPAYASGLITPRPQDHAAATYARKITKADGKLDWSLPAINLRDRMRAFTPWPGAFTNLIEPGGPKFLKIWLAQIERRQGQPGQVLQADKAGLMVACGADALRIEQLQLQGGRKMTAAEFLAGHDVKPGAKMN